MEDLKLTPFSDKEMENEYSTETFTERDIDFTLLRLTSQQNHKAVTYISSVLWIMIINSFGSLIIKQSLRVD